MAVTMSRLGETPCVTLSNDAVDVEVLAGKGADILSITDRATGVNPLWRSRWGHHQLRTAQMSADTTTAWLVSCVGGWNFLFPGGGAESVVQGGLQPMHGEASITSWDVVDHDGADSAGPWVRLSTHLSRSPFALERTVRLVGESGELEVIDRAVNEGGEPFPTAWTQHPTLGPPFLDGSCVIETNAATIEPDDAYDLPHIPMAIGDRRSWSEARGIVGRVPSRGEARQLLSYLHFEEPESWYRVVNESSGLAFSVNWLTSDYPHAWFFQEMDATGGWPWFSNTFIMAIEPSTTWPGRGLAHAVEVDRVEVLQPGASMTKSIRASFGRTA